MINSEVSSKVAGSHDRPTGVLTLTTNARLIGAGPRWWLDRQRQEGQARPHRRVDAAVIVDGVAGFREPSASILFLNPDLARDVDDDYASKSVKKETWAEREDVLQRHRRSGRSRHAGSRRARCTPRQPGRESTGAHRGGARFP